MSEVKSLPIHFHHLGAAKESRPSERSVAGQGDARTSNLLPRQQAGRIRTTGLFAAPSGNGNIVRLDVFLSSFSEEVETARVEVSRLVDGELEPLFFRAIDVPAGGGRRIEVGEVGGETIEVSVELPDSIAPTAAVTQFFLADAGIVTLVYKSPEDFVRL